MAETPVGTTETNPDAEAEALLAEVPTEDAETPVDPDPAADQSDKDAIIARKDDIIRQLSARLHKAKPKPTSAPITPATDGDVRATVASLALAEERRQFGYLHGLTPEETDQVFRANPKPTKEFLEDPFIKGGLQAIRAKKRAESNTPSMSSRSPRFEPVRKENATAEDKQAAFEKFRDAKLAKR